jgi:hypothetical protein
MYTSKPSYHAERPSANGHGATTYADTDELHAAHADALRHLERAQRELLGERNAHAATRDRCKAAEAELQATQEFIANPNLKPIEKVVALNALYLAGAGPGRPASERVSEYTRVSRYRVAKRACVSPTQAGTYIRALHKAGLLRKRIIREYIDPAEMDEPDEDGNMLPGIRNRMLLAPTEGADWMRTWANPRQIGALGRSERLDKDKDHQSEKRAKIAAIMKAIDECPLCHSTDIDRMTLVCGHCHASIETKDLPDAPRGGKRRRGAGDDGQGQCKK